jgi:hypothetical protein
MPAKRNDLLSEAAKITIIKPSARGAAYIMRG